MEDEAKAGGPTAEEQEGSEGTDKMKEDEGRMPLPKPTTLKTATSHLRIEALRRYRIRHSFDIEDYDDRGRQQGQQAGSADPRNVDRDERNSQEPEEEVDSIKFYGSFSEMVVKSSIQSAVEETSSFGEQLNEDDVQQRTSDCISDDDDLVTLGESSIFSLSPFEDELFQFAYSQSNVVLKLEGEDLGFDSDEYATESHYIAPLVFPASHFYIGSPETSDSDSFSPPFIKTSLTQTGGQNSSQSSVKIRAVEHKSEETELTNMETEQDQTTTDVQQDQTTTDVEQDQTTTDVQQDQTPTDVQQDQNAVETQPEGEETPAETGETTQPPTEDQKTENDTNTVEGEETNINKNTVQVSEQGCNTSRPPSSSGVVDMATETDNTENQEAGENTGQQATEDINEPESQGQTDTQQPSDTQPPTDLEPQSQETPPQAELGQTENQEKSSEETVQPADTENPSTQDDSQQDSSDVTEPAKTESQEADGEKTAESTEGQSEQAVTSDDQPGEITVSETTGQSTQQEVEGQADGSEGQQSTDAKAAETTGTGEGEQSAEAKVAETAETVEGEQSAEAKAAETAETEEGDEKPEGDEALNAWGESKNDLKETMSAEFYYSAEEHVSGAVVEDESGLPQDLLTLNHSYGYDCTKRANLHILDESTVCFVAGNLVQLLNLVTKEQTYIRSSSGGGIGAIAVHPSRKYFAVAEKGKSPSILIYEYPSLKLYRILRAGTEQLYSYVDFSPDGELLASQGGESDYMLTVWRWRQEKIVLRSKAFSQEVFRGTFSTELEGQLTTAGTSHIKFWKMADTFTGLKLQGELGKFGRTEISDIEGYVELPDGKVLSGCEWGNLLVWDGGLIKVEISRKGRNSCHHGPIQQILLDEGELMTVGIDGFIRVWDFETIDTAEGADEMGMFEMEPMNELQVETDVKLKSIVKSVDTENEPTIWYAQDGNGGIWKLDLSFSHTSLSPEKLMTYHAGPIWCADTSPVSHLVATTGQDSTVRIFDYVARKQLSEARFTSSGTSVIWAPRNVDQKGSTVIVGFGDGVVRLLTLFSVLDHTAGHKTKEDCEIVLRQAFKPHTGPVTCLSVDPKGETLATGSSDGTVFFMAIGKTYEPIGFVKMPAGVKSIQWSPKTFEKTTLLIFCEGGCAVELTAPEAGHFDTSHTFQMTGLPMKTFQFNSIKSHLRHEEDLACKAKEEEERKKREEEERRKRIERGLEPEEGEEEQVEMTRKKKKEEPWKPYIPLEPSEILSGFYTEEGKFWLSMGDFDSGYFYECKFLSEEEKASLPAEKVDEPIRAVPVLGSDDVPVTQIKFSSTVYQVLMGMENGAVRVQQMDSDAKEQDLALMGPYWMLNIHDNHYGKITSLLTSYDDAFILTVGADGNFFSFNMMEQAKLQARVAEAKARIPSARKGESEKADDIDDPNAYSIEDAKQKAEHDKMMRQAEEKKKDVRRHIAKLRRDFKSLTEQNHGLPPHLQLHRGEFEMDREIKEELQKQIEDKIGLVKKEMAWDSEKHRLALEKLRLKFKEVVECEKIIVKSFNSPHEVASFRTAKLSDDFFYMKALFERRKTTFISGPSRDTTRDLRTGQPKQPESGQAVVEIQDSTDSKVKTSLKGSMGDRISQSLHKVDEKKRLRALRKAQWDDLSSSKPDDDYEDPADVSAIREAKDNMGDYKLKTAQDYVVPDHMRMNVEKARGRLLVIKDLIHQYKYDFNADLLGMRDRKISLIEEMKQLLGELNKVQNQLSEENVLPVPHIPEMHPDEVPEKQLEYTRSTLLSFKRHFDEKELAAKKGTSQSGFGGFGGGEDNAASPPPMTPKQGTSLSSGMHKSRSSTQTEPKEVIYTESEMELSDLEKEIRAAAEVKLLYERDQLMKEINNLKQHFDADLRLLRHDKFQLDIVMKNADLRHVTLFEELVLLKEFEKSEDVLAAKVETKEQEKLDMQAKVLDCQTKLESKKKDIEKLQEREKALLAAFITSLGDNNKFADYLTKVFKKKIKRAKKKTADADGSDEESDEESDDESDWDESDEESESEAGGFDLDVCPTGCDQTLYDNTCQMREKKLDIEEFLAEEKKASEVLKKELESLQKKSKIIDSGLKTAENDLEAFQLEKQQKINELDVVVTLKLHQIQYMVNGVLPQELSNTLVFESTGVSRLQQRIKELQHEKSLQKKQMKESRKQHVQLIKDRKHMESRISEMNDGCNNAMISKFGCIVDLEKLETITVNRNIEELKEKLRVTEIQNTDELHEMAEKISWKKDEITDLIRENTSRLNQLCILMEERKTLENSLDNRQKHVGGEYSGVRKSELREKQRLIQLVQLQAQEVDALKEEITLLSRKGGHILPPAQPPMPQSASM